MGNQQSVKEKKKQEKKQLLQKSGILLPPSFGTCTDAYPLQSPVDGIGTLVSTSTNINKSNKIIKTKPSLQSNALHWIENQSVFGSTSIDIIKYSTPCIRLLNDEGNDNNNNNSIPFGISLNFNTASSSISTSLYKQQNQQQKDNNLLSGEMVFGQLFNDNQKWKSGIGLKVNTHNASELINYGGFIRHDPTGLGVFLSNSNNKSYIGWNLLTTLPSYNKEYGNDCNNDMLWLGSSLQLKSSSSSLQTNSNNDIACYLPNMLKAFRSNDDIDIDNNVNKNIFSNSSSDIKTWLAIKAFNGSLKAGIEFNNGVNPSSFSYINTSKNSSYFLSCQLNDNKTTDSMPPITFTTYNTPSTNSKTYCISQILYYDRYVLNPMDDRCPKIRNTIQWSMKMENRTKSVNASAAFAWQLNRNACIKSKLKSNGVLQNSILLKRWAYPRILTNIVFDINLSSNNKKDASLFSFNGIGIVVETGSTSSDNIDYNTFSLDRKEIKGPAMKYQLVLDSDDDDDDDYDKNILSADDKKKRKYVNSTSAPSFV